MSRLSFSALGDQLALVNTNDGDLCTLMLCNREHWSDSVQLVGHEGTVVASRYSPCVFGAPEGGQNNKNSGADGEGGVARVRRRRLLPLWLVPTSTRTHARASGWHVCCCVGGAGPVTGSHAAKARRGCFLCAPPATRHPPAWPTSTTVSLLTDAL